MSDEIFNTAIDFLENGGDLPKNGNAQQRFIFISGLIKQTYSVAKEANVRSVKNENTLVKWRTSFRTVLGSITLLATVLGILVVLGFL